MFIRLLLILLGLGGGLLAYAKLRTPLLLRVPRKWKAAAKRVSTESSFRKGLELRQRIAHFCLKNEIPQGPLILEEVDGILEGMLELDKCLSTLLSVPSEPSKLGEDVEAIRKELGLGVERISEALTHTASFGSGKLVPLDQICWDLKSRRNSLRAIVETYTKI